MITSLKPYEEMNTAELMMYWRRLKYSHCLTLYESPNKVFWALVNEAKSETLEIRDTNTGQVYQSHVERMVKPEIILTGKVAEPVFEGYIPPTPEPSTTCTKGEVKP